jgi:hypothetical protein
LGGLIVVLEILETSKSGFFKSLLTPKLMPVKVRRRIALPHIDISQRARNRFPTRLPACCISTKKIIPDAPIANVRVSSEEA